MKPQAIIEKIGFASLVMAGLLVVLILFGILANIFYNGFSVLSWEFCPNPPGMG